MRVFKPEKCCAGGGSGGTDVITVSQPLVKDCLILGTVLANDPVYLVGANEVRSATSNDVPSPIIGIAIQQIDVNRWKVLIEGNWILNIPGPGDIYLGTSGKISNIRPTVGTVQRLGFSYGDGVIFINLELQQTYARS